MWDMIYAVGIGFSFAVGVGMGAFLCRIATKEGRTETREDWNKHNDVIVGLLTEKNAVLIDMNIAMQELKNR